MDGTASNALEEAVVDLVFCYHCVVWFTCVWVLHRIGFCTWWKISNTGTNSNPSVYRGIHHSLDVGASVAAPGTRGKQGGSTSASAPIPRAKIDSEWHLLPCTLILFTFRPLWGFKSLIYSDYRGIKAFLVAFWRIHQRKQEEKKYIFL